MAKIYYVKCERPLSKQLLSCAVVLSKPFALYQYLTAERAKRRVLEVPSLKYTSVSNKKALFCNLVKKNNIQGDKGYLGVKSCK